MQIRNLLLLCIVLPFMATYAQTAKPAGKPAKKTFVAMFYNVENLFDTRNDPKTIDEEFTPEGKVPWTEERFQTKIGQISQVINDIATPEVPDIIGFAETENRFVLEKLLALPKMSRTKYGIVQFDSPDERGIDVSMIYNTATFTVISSEPLKVKLPTNDYTRDILYVKGKLKTGEILHVFVNHWPSRREGTELSDPNRLAAATVLREKLNLIQKTEKSANILIMGDFNDEATDKSINTGLGAKVPAGSYMPNDLYSVLYPYQAKGEGSLYYKDWDLFDQILVSGNLLNRKKGFRTSVEAAKIFKAEYLLFKNNNGEMRPNRTMSSTKYFGGYSDHLPVFITFSLK